MTLPFSDIAPLDKSVPGVQPIEALILPRLPVLYAKRAARLRMLAEHNGAYLEFLASLVEAQKFWLEQHPITPEQAMPVTALMGAGALAPVKPTQQLLATTPYWHTAFKHFVHTLAPLVSEPVASKLEAAAHDTSEQLAAKAAALFNQDYAAVDAGVAVLLWAALSVYWAQAVALVGVQKHTAQAHNEASCPCCGASPVGGLVLTGDREGLRYLQCSLCETRWHAVRATCVVCYATQHIDYWTFEKTDAPIQIETCGDCHSYLKIFRQDRDPQQDALADDLVSQTLDEALEAQGFARAGVNPFSFPS
ncbi:formate dehydrogenase accessory protein FdhE [Acetobacter orientalis]|uniref:formate dehydrogenase accessory protein FdhE n=1 Tax=Acetobacter orientalis TaxID=146474 RepID=UPI0039ED4D38